MSKRLLVAYETKYGSTKEVAETIGAELRGRGLQVDIVKAGNVGTVEGYDAVVLGAPLYMGRWRRTRPFLRRHRRALGERPFAVFALGPLGDDEKAFDGPAKQLRQALAKAHVTPAAVGLFGGVIDRSKLRFPFNRMPAGDWRDWDAIRAWSDEVARLVVPEGAPQPVR
jgi:menaquinone-dependent protoporphyrinogen oxidase